VFATWQRNGQPDDVLFGVVAKIDMRWLGDKPTNGFPFDIREFINQVEL